MSGHLQKRGKKSWRLKFEAERDPATGKRKIQYQTFRGTRQEAKAKLIELLASVGKGTYVEANKITVAEFVKLRIEQWEGDGTISARTAARYRELLTNQIAPHIGAKVLQKLRPLDIEEWHTTLRNNGRAGGKGGLAARTIGHAHRVLSKALSDALKNELTVKNVARTHSAPKVFARGPRQEGHSGPRSPKPSSTEFASRHQSQRLAAGTSPCPTFWSMPCANIARRNSNSA